MKNELYVLRSPHHEQIEVHSAATFALQRVLRIAGLNDEYSRTQQSIDYYNWPCRMASCETNSCIYVSEWYGNTVYKVHVDALNAIDKPFKWQVGKGPVGLSVDKDGHLLVTCYGANILQKYTPVGSLIHTVSLQQTEVADPVHAVAMSNGHYAVCHWGPVHGVSIVDREGLVVHTYRNDPELNTRLLNEPRYLAVNDTDCIMVGHIGKNRVILLNSSLQYFRDLPLSLVGNIQDPGCLYLDESRGRLFVGEYRGHRALVFHDVKKAEH